MRRFIPRFTLAGFLLAIAGLAGLYGSITSHMRPELLQTGNLLDLCVVGNGHLIARDPGADACCGLAVRSARFHLDTTGQISIRHQGKEFLLEPGICVPSEATAVSILQDGQVLYRNRGSDFDCTAGQLQLGIFPSTGLLHPLGDPQTVSPILAFTDESPIRSIPGDTGYGHIQSGMLIRQPNWLEATFYVGRDVFLAMCGLVAIRSLWTNWGSRKAIDTPLGASPSS